jgi:hypothetical protein
MEWSYKIGLVATLLFGTTLASQNHDQGVQQYRTQYNIWYRAADASKLSVAELNKRNPFLTGCELTDQSDPPQSFYKFLSMIGYLKSKQY